MTEPIQAEYIFLSLKCEYSFVISLEIQPNSATARNLLFGFAKSDELWSLQEDEEIQTGKERVDYNI